MCASSFFVSNARLGKLWLIVNLIILMRGIIYRTSLKSGRSEPSTFFD